MDDKLWKILQGIIDSEDDTGCSHDLDDLDDLDDPDDPILFL